MGGPGALPAELVDSEAPSPAITAAGRSL